MACQFHGLAAKIMKTAAVSDRIHAVEQYGAKMIKRTLFLLLLLFACSTLATAAADTLPTRKFFEHHKIVNMKLSPDGAHVALTFEKGSEVGLAIMALDDEKITASFEFGDNRHVLGFWWGSNKRVVMAVGEVTGNLDHTGRPQQLYAANLDGRQRLEIFNSATLGPFEVLHPLPDNERHILITRRYADGRSEPKPNHLNIFNGKTRSASGLPPDNDIVEVMADNDGDIRIAGALRMGDSLDDRELRLYARHDGEWKQVNLPSKRASANVNFVAFSPDNSQAYFTSNHDQDSNDRLGIFRYDFDLESIELLYRHDELDIGGLIYGPKREVLGAITRFGPANYHFFDDEISEHRQAAGQLVGLIRAFPDDNLHITSTDRDGKHSIVHVSGDRNPGSFYLLNTESMEMRFLAATLPDLPGDRLMPMKPVMIEARDGLKLHALLTLPEGGDKNLPLIVNVHGGPFGISDTWGYNPEAQFMAHHGYATLQVNYRGSGGRGEDFEQAGWREWGGKMQDDVTDATRWAIEQGIADENRICIYGGSYGGYASLMGVIREPDLYQCAVGYVGVYDLPWFRSGDGNDFSKSTSYGREGRANFERFMSSTVGNDEDRLKAASPVHNVDKIKAELYLVHGASDVRVVIGHFERLRKALDNIGKSYRSMVKKKEGHGFYDIDNRVELYDSMLEFFDRHIGAGRQRAGD